MDVRKETSYLSGDPVSSWLEGTKGKDSLVFDLQALTSLDHSRWVYDAELILWALKYTVDGNKVLHKLNYH